MSTFCIVDVETTGFKPHRDNIWSVSGIKVVRGQVDSLFDSLARPRNPAKASEFVKASGIEREKFEDAIAIEFVAQQAFQFFKGFTIYAYKASFDKRMLVSAHSGFNRLRFVDYLPIVKERRPGLKSYKLEEISKVFNLNHKKKGYDSLNDCYTLLDLIKKLGL